MVKSHLHGHTNKLDILTVTLEKETETDVMGGSVKWIFVMHIVLRNCISRKMLSANELFIFLCHCTLSLSLSLSRSLSHSYSVPLYRSLAGVAVQVLTQSFNIHRVLHIWYSVPVHWEDEITPTAAAEAWPDALKERRERKSECRRIKERCAEMIPSCYL